MILFSGHPISDFQLGMLFGAVLTLAAFWALGLAAVSIVKARAE